MGTLSFTFFIKIAINKKKAPTSAFTGLNEVSLAQSIPENHLKPSTKITSNTNSENSSIESKKIGATIKRIESELKDRDVVQRLNADQVGPQERAQLSDQLQQLTHLRAQGIEQQLEEMTRTVANLTANHSRRLQAFGVTP